MDNLKLLEKDIFETLNERRTVSYLAGYRRTVEGMFRILLDDAGINYGNRLELGSLTKGNLLKHITDDVGIKYDINYVRLYGNRASHSGNIFYDSDILVVNSAYKRLVYFFYEKSGREIPKYIKDFIDRLKVSEIMIRDVYNKDVDLYLDALISIEQSDKNYPAIGLKLLQNIISKILTDHEGRVPESLYNIRNKFLNIENAIGYLKQNNIIEVNRISQLESLFFSFLSGLQVLKNDDHRMRSDRQTVTDEIRKTLVNFTNWFFKIESTEKRQVKKKAASNVVDLITLGTFIITLILGIDLFNWDLVLNRHYSGFSVPVNYTIVILLFAGISFFTISYIFNVLYPYIPILQKRKLYTLSRGFNAVIGLIGVVILAFISYWLLHDKKLDGQHLPFFTGAFLWSVFLQISNILKSETDSRYDKLMRGASYLLLIIIIGISIWFSFDYKG